ncbi:MAG: GxxExxY protein [Alphaproteobacteria bacterium]
MSELVEISEKTNLISKEILDTCFFIHTKLGPGLLKSVYEECLFYLLNKKSLKVERQKTFPIQIDDLIIPTGLKLDLLVENSIIVELKAVEKILPVHEAQIHTYLKLSQIPLGLLVNFNVRSLKDGIKRIAMSKTLSKNFA